MGKLPISLFAIIFSIIVVSCDNTKKSDSNGTDSDTTSSQTPDDEKDKKPSCSFEYVHDSTMVSWTAFKFNDRAGVGGRFDSCSVTPETAKGSVVEVIENLSFQIPVSQSNSNNPDRDQKILKSFWGSLTNTTSISGVINSVHGNDKKGKATVGLVMNEVEHEVEATYEVMEDGHFALKTKVNMEDFDGMKAISALNELCKELHTGPDGKSKLWPDVDVVVTGYFKKDCKEKK